MVYERICVIPDIHNLTQRAQRILDANTGKVDIFVFLGDYFHSFGDKPGDIARTGRWLRTVQDRDDCVTLCGNHDASHLHREARCSGWSIAKHEIFLAMAGTTDFMQIAKLRPSFDYGGLLCTHAGVYEGISYPDQVRAVHDLIQNERFDYTFLDAHQRDGGSMNPAGILWGRHTYNKPRTDLGFQVFGHTPGERVVKGKSWLCLDTNLHHYAIFEFDTDMKMSSYKIHEAK